MTDKKVEIKTEETFVHGGFGKRVEKTNQNPNGWEEGFFEETKICPNKKTILYFGGNGTTQAGHANFGCKLIESLVGKAEENGFDLFGFYYSHNEITKTYIDTKTGKILKDDNGNEMIVQENDTGGFDEKQFANVYNSFFKPLFLSENGKLFSSEEIEKNLQNLKIFAYCKGSAEANKLLGASNQFLSEKFGKEKAKQLLSNVFVFHYAPFAEPEFGTNVEFKSLRDYLSKEPWKASKEGWGFLVEEPFLGVADTAPNKNKNGLEVFSNSFVSVESLMQKNRHDEHSIADYLKIEGVVDRMALPNFFELSPKEKEEAKKLKKQGKTSKRPSGYSRQQAISDLMSSALSYGLVADKPNLDDLKMILDCQIKNENKTVFEKEQKKLFEQEMKTQKQEANENSKTKASSPELSA